MSKKSKIIGFLLLGLGTVLVTALYLRGKTVAVFNPMGTIAAQERNLMLFCLEISLIIVIPVFALTFFFSWRYREGNTSKKKKYTPDWDGSRILETVWWLVPTALIVVIAVVTWQSSHKLDPFKPIASHTQPLKIQVVALDWKWLFIYPEQHIATVNYVSFPEKTPINFEITADAPMNSFWIPQLGGQIYAMAGMSTHMNLMADDVGDYRGSSANISGKGFADMIFSAESRSKADFDTWVSNSKHSKDHLSQAAYDKLAQPSEHNRIMTYSTVEPALYDKIIMKYMAPSQ